jgi:hypothetical protein
MSIQRVPRAAFNLKLQSQRRARHELAKMLQQHLMKRFGAVRVFRRFFFPVSVLTLTVNRNVIVVTLRGKPWKRFDENEWYVRVNPLRYPVPIKNLPEDEGRKYERDLMLVSDEIHGLLTHTSGVTRLRWFFQGWDVGRPGVLSPAELPWHVEVPELRAGQNRTTS